MGAEIRNFPDDISPEQLKELTELENQKRENFVLSLTVSTLGDEYEKQEVYWRKKKEDARKAEKIYDQNYKDVAIDAAERFKKYKMKKMNKT